MNELFTVEFVFENEDYADLITLGVFTDLDIAEAVAFDYAEDNIDNPDMSALFITKFIPNEVLTEEILTAYYFDEEE